MTGLISTQVSWSGAHETCHGAEAPAAARRYCCVSGLLHVLVCQASPHQSQSVFSVRGQCECLCTHSISNSQLLAIVRGWCVGGCCRPRVRACACTAGAHRDGARRRRGRVRARLHARCACRQGGGHPPPSANRREAGLPLTGSGPTWTGSCGPSPAAPPSRPGFRSRCCGRAALRPRLGLVSDGRSSRAAITASSDSEEST